MVDEDWFDEDDDEDLPDELDNSDSVQELVDNDEMDGREAGFLSGYHQDSEV